jgi:hypothetical protein
MDNSSGDCYAVGMGFVSDINHMGLALGVKVGESDHSVGKNE